MNAEVKEKLLIWKRDVKSAKVKKLQGIGKNSK